jgi:hypothetical protein
LASRRSSRLSSRPRPVNAGTSAGNCAGTPAALARFHRRVSRPDGGGRAEARPLRTVQAERVGELSHRGWPGPPAADLDAADGLRVNVGPAGEILLGQAQSQPVLAYLLAEHGQPPPGPRGAAGFRATSLHAGRPAASVVPPRGRRCPAGRPPQAATNGERHTAEITDVVVTASHAVTGRGRRRWTAFWTP